MCVCVCGGEKRSIYCGFGKVHTYAGQPASVQVHSPTTRSAPCTATTFITYLDARHCACPADLIGAGEYRCQHMLSRCHSPLTMWPHSYTDKPSEESVQATEIRWPRCPFRVPLPTVHIPETGHPTILHTVYDTQLFGRSVYNLDRHYRPHDYYIGRLSWFPQSLQENTATRPLSTVHACARSFTASSPYSIHCNLQSLNSIVK
jgi:hypothetical protein